MLLATAARHVYTTTVVCLALSIHSVFYQQPDTAEQLNLHGFPCLHMCRHITVSCVNVLEKCMYVCMYVRMNKQKNAPNEFCTTLLPVSYTHLTLPTNREV